jgi:hypothetical protein
MVRKLGVSMFVVHGLYQNARDEKIFEEIKNVFLAQK